MKIKSDTIIRSILTLIVIVNIILKSLGIPCINASEDTISMVLEAILEVIIIVAGFWNNNSFTRYARIADEYLDELRNEECGADEITLDEFERRFELGKSYAWAGGYMGECVSLVKNYISLVLGIKPQSIGNAKEYWLKRKLSYIADNFELIDRGPAMRGDIFVRTTGTYGHVGIVTSATDKMFKTIEQNSGGSRIVSNESRIYADNIHFLRPKNQQNIRNNSINPVIKVNATITKACKTHKENTQKTVLGSVEYGERVRCLTHGKSISIIQYATSKTEYATGCIPSKNVALD